MSSYSISRQPRRLLPASMEAALARLFRRAVGLALLSLALAGWLSLLTWSIADPSFNHVTERAPQNVLGMPGAAVADLLIQSVGLASPFVFLPVAALGFRLATGMLAGPLRLMTLVWPIAIALIATSLSPIPATESWPLARGLGGIVGDVLIVVSVYPFGFVPDAYTEPVAAAAAGLSGLWAVLIASGLYMRDLAVLWEGGSPGLWRRRRVATGARAGAERTGRSREERGGPREFWMWGRVPDEAGDDERPAPASSPAEPRDGTWLRLPRIGRRGDADGPAARPAAPAMDQDARVEPFFGTAPGPPRADRAHSDIWAAHHRAHEGADRGFARRGGPPAEPANTGGTVRRGTARGFSLPPASLLAPAGPSVQDSLSDEELTERAEQLEGMLRDFGVKGEVTEVHPGPVITLYELRPARGTKSSRVIGLSEDIARSMGAVSARVSVIPGRDALGIELPNERRETVYLRALLEAHEFRTAQAKLALALGKSIGGEPVIVDLARMPHLLIAGTTGSGKSVGINAMILSLLYRLPPQQCKVIMIDPKMLELSVYNGIPHLLTPVITEPKQAVAALKWTVAEMNRRYERMHKVGVRNIQGYNQRVADALARGDVLGRTVNTGFDTFTGEPVYEHEDIDAEPMPYIVVVIDEMADLMMTAGKDVELAVQRLSQMARAAGIHLIMATQRPSVDVITGTIKANFPCRISFQVSSKIDSRTILEEQGAEQLLGAGDMLHMGSGRRLMRVHGPFVTDQELEKVVRHLKRQGAPDYRPEILEAHDEPVDPRLAGEGKSGGGDVFDEAVEIVRRDRRATTSYLQRRLGIGYNRAATLVERMEQEGLVGPAGPGGKREIYLDRREGE